MSNKIATVSFVLWHYLSMILEHLPTTKMMMTKKKMMIPNNTFQ